MRQEDLDKLRKAAIASPEMIIGGAGVAASSGNTLDVISPIDGSHLASIPDATEQDVETAVAAARNSFEDGVWARTAPAARKKIMLRWAELIEHNALELAVLGVRDNATYNVFLVMIV